MINVVGAVGCERWSSESTCDLRCPVLTVMSVHYASMMIPPQILGRLDSMRRVNAVRSLCVGIRSYAAVVVSVQMALQRVM